MRHNGIGKSSILKLLMVEKINFDGFFYIENHLRISYIPQDISKMNGSLKEYENNNDIDITLFRTILKKLYFPSELFEKNIELFSDGQKKKVLLAHSLSSKAHLYIWDEPLNFIDVFSRIQIEELLMNSEATIIFVEHDKLFCNNIANKIIHIKN